MSIKKTGWTPRETQDLQDIQNGCCTLNDLVIKDKIASERKFLKDLILAMEDDSLLPD